jgi:prepilin-type N-terminal cleavage/methylation domain-containing protein
MTRTRRRRGFTLVEVLATMVLLAIILPVAMKGISLAMAAGATARRTADAATLAEAKLNELVADGTWTSGQLSGNFAPDQPDYQWQCVTATRDYGLTEIGVRVTWLDRGLPRQLTVATLALQSAAQQQGVLP